MQFCMVYTGHLNKGNEINHCSLSQEKWPSANVPFETEKNVKLLENYKKLNGAGTAMLFWTPSESCERSSIPLQRGGSSHCFHSCQGIKFWLHPVLWSAYCVYQHSRQVSERVLAENFYSCRLPGSDKCTLPLSRAPHWPPLASLDFPHHSIWFSVEQFF